MARILEGHLNGASLRVAIVVSRFNEFISRKLLEGALDCLRRHETNDDKIDIIWVPGAFEIPLVAKRTAASGKYDTVLCLGAVIRGATPHFDYVSAEVTKGIALAGMETGIPVIFGILTTESIEQAIERAGTKSGNKGWDAALSGIEMAQLLRSL